MTMQLQSHLHHGLVCGKEVLQAQASMATHGIQLPQLLRHPDLK